MTLLKRVLIASLFLYFIYFIPDAYLGQNDPNYALNLRLGKIRWTDGLPLIDKPITFQSFEENKVPSLSMFHTDRQLHGFCTLIAYTLIRYYVNFRSYLMKDCAFLSLSLSLSLSLAVIPFNLQG